MFEPKVYKSNNLEAYHLISEDGSSFLYEGKVEYIEDQLFKDEQGRSYYLVTTSITGALKYYVEVEPRGLPIPLTTGNKEKAIADLITASPREGPAEEAVTAKEPPPEPATSEASMPGPEHNTARPEWFIFDKFLASVHPEDNSRITAAIRAAALTDEKRFSFDYKSLMGRAIYAEGEVVCNKTGVPMSLYGTFKDVIDSKPSGEALRDNTELKPVGRSTPDTCFESHDKAVSQPEPTVMPTVTEEAQAAVKAMASLPEHKPRKKKPFFTLPRFGILLIIILLIASMGVFVYRPDLVSGTNLPFVSNPSSTPEPTVTPEPTPLPTATPQPTNDVQPGSHEIFNKLLALVPAIDDENGSVTGFANNNSNASGTSFGKLAKVCDLFDYVNKNWALTKDNDTPQKASESIRTLKGSDMDYSVLMAGLTGSMGMESRVVAVYNADVRSYDYYPEIKVAKNDNDYNDALVYIRARYDVKDPYGQADGIEHWLSLSRGKAPGLKINSTYGYAVNSKGEISPV